jgi:hypothetical protein
LTGGVDHVYFTLSPSNCSGIPLRGISCYEHVAASAVRNEKDVTRAAVQKAVVLISIVPFLSALKERLAPVTRAYAGQHDFSARQILIDFHKSVNTIAFESFNSSQLYHGLRLRPLVRLYDASKILQILKLMLLEARVVVYSSTANQAATACLSLVNTALLCWLDSIFDFVCACVCPGVTNTRIVGSWFPLIWLESYAV